MIDKWLLHKETDPNPFATFTLISVTENVAPDLTIKEYLSAEMLKAYRDLDFLKFHFKSEPKEKLKDYLVKNVFANDSSQITKNVKQGDFAEVLAGLIVTHFQKLTVPLQKLRWKFNNNRSVFCTDMIAHNTEKDIKDIYYYEIKSRLGIKKESPAKGIPANYITINAHNSLLKDESNSNEGIADFLCKYFYDKEDFDKSTQYGDIVKSPKSYNRNFELFFIIESKEYIKEILDDLEKLPPALKPLNTTVVLIANLKDLVTEIHKIALAVAVKHVYE
jgi:hypothetical protein